MKNMDQLRMELTGSLRPTSMQWLQIAQEMLMVHGISASRSSTLLGIVRLGEGISHGTLAKDLGIESASLARTVNLLVWANLIRRGSIPGDRRVKTLWLTESGKELTGKIETELAALRARLLAQVDRADLEAALRVLQVLKRASRLPS